MCTSGCRREPLCSSRKMWSSTGCSFSKTRFRPEDIAYFRQIRQQCATPIAMGELFNSPHEWTPLISERLIDYIRVHVSQAGGFTPAARSPRWAKHLSVKTAWHGPGDVSPIGHMANVTLDVTCYNFGIQEWSGMSERSKPYSRAARNEERLRLSEREAGLGHRGDDEGRGGEISVTARSKEANIND